MRRSLILDRTAEVVARDGIATLTMEIVGNESGVSKSLIYNYFPNMTELLRALLQRELRDLRRLQAGAAASAATFEELVRSITHEYVKYVSERGLILQRLQAEPSVSALHDPTDYDRDVAVDYLARIVAQHFDLPADVARAATDISFGVPASAGEYLLRHGADPAKIEDLAVTMIIGMFRNLSAEYHTRRQPLKRDTVVAP